MSIARNLVDLYVLASTATKISTSVVSSQASAVCHHVKTSSILNPTTVVENKPAPQQQQQTTEPTQLQSYQTTAIEVPFPDVANGHTKELVQQVEIQGNVIQEGQTSDAQPCISKQDNVKTHSVQESCMKEETIEKPSNVIYSVAGDVETSPPIEPVVTFEAETLIKKGVETPEVQVPKVEAPKVEVPKVEAPKVEVPKVEAPIKIETPIKIDTPKAEKIIEEVRKVQEIKKKELKASHIPTSRIGRLWNYGTLATGMGLGAINESIKRATGISQDNSGSVLLSESNVNRLVEKLSRMRGAALKMGQMLSIQGIQAAGDKSGLPPQLEQVLLRVHDSANYMPQKQMERVMANELGGDWQSYFKDFDPIPIAAASIGQVHGATLAATNEPVVIKVQYPGVAESIDSDLSNLKALVTFSNLLPRGLYLDNTIKVTKQELAWECDYIREANNTIRFKEMLANDNRFKVPTVVKDLCTPKVLVSERLTGQTLSKAIDESQELRNMLGENLLRLCLREVFSFKFMQTDPNWSNFFYNKNQIELLDFGACREFGGEFVQAYGRILASAANNDREGVWKYSKDLGFVTGYETEVMRNAHIDSVMVLGEPFRKTAPDTFDFSNQTITQRVRDTIPVMLRHRLTPPPDETYGLHKKLSGAFLLCTKLRSQFDTKTVWKEEVERVFKM